MFCNIYYLILNLKSHQGWPGLGDGYCHVERCRSWKWIKLMRQRAGGAPLQSAPGGAGPRETQSSPWQVLAPSKGPPLRPCGNPARGMGSPGVSTGGESYPQDSRLAPAYLALAPIR